MAKSKIEWTDVTWSPVTGCTKMSAGCKHCYAERMARRLAGRFGYPEAPSHFDVTLHPDRLKQPLHWRKPRRIFVCSMGDLFHKDVSLLTILDIWAIMKQALEHTFLVLTKRPDRMHFLLADTDFPKSLASASVRRFGFERHGYWPLPNVWLGVSVENQQAADERIPLLLETPAPVRFVSVEPMLGSMDLHKGLGLYEEAETVTAWYGGGHRKHTRIGLTRKGFNGYRRHDGRKLDWVICGGESGPGARPMHPQWARDLRDQCVAAETAFHFKQWGAWFPRLQWEHNPDLILPDDCDCIEGRNLKTIGDDIMHRVGKGRAGRLLDGRTWDEYPTGKEVVNQTR